MVHQNQLAVLGEPPKRPHDFQMTISVPRRYLTRHVSKMRVGDSGYISQEAVIMTPGSSSQDLQVWLAANANVHALRTPDADVFVACTAEGLAVCLSEHVWPHYSTGSQFENSKRLGICAVLDKPEAPAEFTPQDTVPAAQPVQMPFNFVDHKIDYRIKALPLGKVVAISPGVVIVDEERGVWIWPDGEWSAQASKDLPQLTIRRDPDGFRIQAPRNTMRWTATKNVPEDAIPVIGFARDLG